MRGCVELLFIGLLIVGKGFCTERCNPKIAIIGGGIGGASASHFLTDLFGRNLNIEVFEANKIGGRLATVKIGENSYEAGGSIIHTKNLYMQDFVKLLGLEKQLPDGKEFGIWNKDKFVFKTSSWDIITTAKLFFRYGIQPYRLNSIISSWLDDFGKIYGLQDSGEAFTNVNDLLSAMNVEFPKQLNISIKDYLLNLGFSSRFIDELISSVILANYGQDTDIHSFVGSIAISGSGSDLWAVKGGNKGVPENLLYRNDNVSIIHSEVKKIRYIAEQNTPRQYEVHYSNNGQAETTKNVYDIVIIAMPLTSDQKMPITFEGFPKEDELKFPGEYQTTVATFVEGNQNPHYFGLEKPLDMILSCDVNKTKISCLGKLSSIEGVTTNCSKVWKIFSREPLKTQYTKNMFLQMGQVKQIKWKAYPRYSTNVRMDKFKLHDFLYHVNAIEWAGSAMEMSAVAGRNVAILAHKDYSTKYNSHQKCRSVVKISQSTLSSEL